MKALSLAIIVLSLSMPVLSNGIGDRIAFRTDGAGDTLSLYNGKGVCEGRQLSAVLNMGDKLYSGCWDYNENAKKIYIFLVDTETPSWHFSYDDFTLTPHGAYEAGIK